MLDDPRDGSKVCEPLDRQMGKSGEDRGHIVAQRCIFYYRNLVRSKSLPPKTRDGRFHLSRHEHASPAHTVISFTQMGSAAAVFTPAVGSTIAFTQLSRWLRCWKYH